MRTEFRLVREGNVLHTPPHHTSMAVAVAVTVPGGNRPCIRPCGAGAGAGGPLLAGCTVAALTWQSPGTGTSPPAIVEEFRRRLSSRGEEEIADLFRQSIVEQDMADHGVIIAGYGSTATRPEIWRIDLRGGVCDGARCVAGGDEPLILWFGEIEALGRLYRQCAPLFGRILDESGISPEERDRLVRAFRDHLTSPHPIPPLALGDVITLTSSLADLVEGAARYLPGVVPLAGPVEIAAVTREEGVVRVGRDREQVIAF